MTYILPRLVAAFLMARALGAQAAGTDMPSPRQAELDAAYKAAQDTHLPGPADIAMRDQAHLKLPAGYLWIPQPAAGKLMQAMGNTVDDSFVGAIFPAGDGDWFVVVKFVKEGYIRDDDAKEWNADELLTSLREGTEAANEERAKRGIGAIEVVGWAQKPQYDSATHRLAWSALTRSKGDTSGEQGVNYNTYALGREGYVSLNMVTAAHALEKYKPEALALLGALQYDEGKRYADFNGSTDKVAAYGLTALVAGAAAKKLGLLAVIAAFLAKFAKVAIVAGGAAVWGFAKLFGKKKSEGPKA